MPTHPTLLHISQCSPPTGIQTADLQRPTLCAHTQECSPPAPPKETRRSGKLRPPQYLLGNWLPEAQRGSRTVVRVAERRPGGGAPPASGRSRILPKAERPSSGTRHPTCTPRMGGRLSPSAPRGPGAPQGEAEAVEEAPQAHLCDADCRPAAASAYGFCPGGSREAETEAESVAELARPPAGGRLTCTATGPP